MTLNAAPTDLTGKVCLVTGASGGIGASAVAPHKIRVNAICPGVIDTPMRKDVDALFAKFENKPIGQKKREVGDAVPLGYMGDPADVARAGVFLASDQSSYMTAQTIGVDGGNVLR